ncbi:MAG TPA: hypothetical protein VGH38_01770 [Bryobacteraceae bacterium]
MSRYRVALIEFADAYRYLHAGRNPSTRRPKCADVRWHANPDAAPLPDEKSIG